MEDVLLRLKRERRWALALFLIGAALIWAVQWGLVPAAHQTTSAPAAETAP